MEPTATQAPRYKHYLKLVAKAALTGLALYLVYLGLDIQALGRAMASVQWVWLIPAFLVFVLSKLFNALRLQAFFACTGMHLDTTYHIKLYLVGMFYNLFLPGGIGGDGYKVLILRKVEGTRTRDLITASLLDRVSGLVTILFLATGTAFFSEIYVALSDLQWIFWLGVTATFPSYALAMVLIFPKYRPVILSSILYSLVVQILIFVAVVFILIALNVDQYFIEYYTLFMIAVIAASLPVTIGGLGLREAALVYLPTVIAIPVMKDTAVALSLLFMLITVLTSLGGVLINARTPVLKKRGEAKGPAKSSSA